MLRLADDFEAIQLVSGVNDSSATVHAGAAVLVRRLGKYALDQGLSGFNFALGIPGTVGGALLTNAGASLIRMERLPACIVTNFNSPTGGWNWKKGPLS
jgi:UDP-N-acetylenolpyruvoylglucosamine reductase